MHNRKSVLALGVGTAALATSLAMPAHAACTVDGSTVTCTADSTAAEVNAALAAVAGGDAILVIADAGTVVQPGSPVAPTQQGAVVINNGGELGTDAAPVGVNYGGDDTAAENTFALDNSGSITGGVGVFNVGGSISIDNSGLLGNGILVSTAADADIDMASSGDIEDGGIGLFTRGDIDLDVSGNVGAPADDTTASSLQGIQANSQQFVSEPAATTTETDGTATTTTTESSFSREGGSVSVNLAEGANSGQINAVGLVSADVTVDGTVGSQTQLNGVGAFSNAQEGTDTTVTVVDGADSTTTTTSVRTQIGGAASIAVGETGSVAGTLNASGDAGAAVTVNGTVGTEDDTASAFAASNQRNLTTVNSSSVAGTINSNSFEQVSTSVGGEASIVVGENGVVTGGVSSNGVGGASTSVDGSVGLEDSTTFADAVSLGTIDTSNSTSSLDTDTGNSSFSNSSSTSRNGGDASVSIGETGVVNGSSFVDADGDASIDVAGLLTGSATARSNSTNFQSAGSGSTVGTVSTSEFSSSNETAGNGASIAVLEGGAVLGGVSAEGTTSASVSVDGTVGEDDNRTFANASARGNANTSSSENSFDTDTGASAFASENSSTPNGGDASLAIGETGNLFGSAFVSADGDAGVSNAGSITGPVFVTANAQASENASFNADDGAGETSFGNSSTNAGVGGSASISNAAGATIGEDPTAPVSVVAEGNTSAAIDNDGRINGSVTARSNSFANENASLTNISDTTDATTLVETFVREDLSARSTTNLGGDASFENGAGGLVTGSVNVNGTGSASVTNSGAVIGTTFASSQATDTTNSREATSTSVFTPGADGGTVTAFAETTTSTQISSGGDVVGTYAGTNGAVQFAPFGGSSDGSVTQNANGDSIATVSGTIFGNFNGNASGFELGTEFNDSQGTVSDGDGDLRETTRSATYDETNRQTDSNSSLVVDDGSITGDASVFATGSASTLIAGEIEGNLSVTAQGFGGYDFAQTLEESATFDEDGVFVESSSVFTQTNDQVANQGTASVVISDGSVGGSVNISGAGGANTFALGAEGSVGGSVFQSNTYSTTDSDFAETTTSVATDAGTVTTVNTQQSNLTTAEGGDVTADVAGIIGLGGADPAAYGDVAGAGGTNLSLNTNAGSASVNLTGQVRNGISINAAGTNTSSASDRTTVDGATTAFSSESSTTFVGGTASLSVDAADLDTPANFGSVNVFGLSGSAVEIGATSSVLAATTGQNLTVGGYRNDTASSQTDVFDDTTLIGRTTTFNATNVGGDSSLINDGRIGFDGGTSFLGANAFVNVLSPTSVQATNNNQIWGSINLNSLFSDFSSTTTSVDLDDVTRVDTTDASYVAGGGQANLLNDGLISGSASVAAAEGSVTNNGVLRQSLSLGGRVDNYDTQTVDTLTQLGEETVVGTNDLFSQSYTVDQSGLLGGSINVNGVFGFVDDEVQTSSIDADINLNDGSVTVGGVFAQLDQDTGDRLTTTNVNLVGSGYLGLGANAIDQLEDAFGTIDPLIAADEDLSRFMGGARVVGVETLTKSGNGVFLITGTAFAPMTSANPSADYTLDVGTFAITGGEIQLAVMDDDDVFGIRGDVSNAAGFVLGNRVELEAPLFGTNASLTAIDGVEVMQEGNFAQSGNGTLTVGVLPTLVRVADPAFSPISSSTNPLAVQQIGVSSGLFTTPEAAFGLALDSLGTGFLAVNGDLALGGTVELVTPTFGIFTDGQTVDFASATGAVTTGAGVTINSSSNFVSFDLSTRMEGGLTIVSATASRAGFETAANNQNATAAGTALTAAFPNMISTIQAASLGGIGLGGDQFALSQDLANVLVGFDSLLTMDQVGNALNELASGEFYGSLTTLKTTAPFVDAISTARVSQGDSGFNVWLAPSGAFVNYDGDATVGSRDLDADNYGGSAGFGIDTGSGEIGVGVGYGRVSANSGDDQVMAEADTWMLGAFVRQAFGNFGVGANIVYGWSDWNTTRILPTLSRTALAEFDSTELRGDLLAEYMFDFGGGFVAPFGQLSFRKFDFDAFSEEGAGAIGLIVDESDNTVFTPEIGARVGTTFQAGIAALRPELRVSYQFQGENDSFRDVAYAAAPGNQFRLQGVDPDGIVNIGAGLFADLGGSSGAFLRGNYATGENVDNASISAGVTIGF